MGQLGANCYLISDESSREVLIVDPGDDADYIARAVADDDLIPVKMVATHGHFDHLMAAAALKLRYKIPFLIHQKDEFLVQRARESAREFLGIDIGITPVIDGYIKQDDRLAAGNGEFVILETPGHTPGSICLFYEKERILLAGDLIFAGGGTGRTDFSYCRENDLRQSIKRILCLPLAVRVYAGHGEETTLADFRLAYAR